MPSARLDKALRSFFHPSADHVLLWDLKRLPDMRHNTDVIKDPDQRRKIEAVIDHFADHVLPLLGDLRWQIIHNDANSSNVLVAQDGPDRITGIIDYGDMIHAPLICDVAIAAAGISQNTDDPVSAICEVAAGFDGVTPLDAEEVDLIYDLVSEATDISWRMAKMHSGKSGAIVIEKAYHGGTDAIDAFSPADRPGDEIPTHIRTIVTPNTYRGEFRGDDAAARYAADADRAIAELDEAGYGVGAVIIDSSFVNHGIIDVPAGYLELVVDKVRAAGGVFIADEVQAGFGRMGSHMWGCQVHGVDAEILALGKPIGNGLALGAIITTPEILASFTEKTGYFSTFGGNPVACAAGGAVLDVIEDEQLLANAMGTGKYLRQSLRTLAQRHCKGSD